MTKTTRLHVTDAVTVANNKLLVRLREALRVTQSQEALCVSECGCIITARRYTYQRHVRRARQLRERILELEAWLEEGDSDIS